MTASIAPRTARKAAIDRAIKTVKSHGMRITSVKLGADGSVEVLTSTSKGDAVADELEAFRQKRTALRAGAVQEPG